MVNIRGRISFLGATARGRILGISPYYFTSQREHPSIDVEHFARDLAKESPTNRFTAKHLSEILCANAQTNVFRHLESDQMETVFKNIPDCHDNDAEIMQLLLAWFDIFNAAFFGNGLGCLRDRIRLRKWKDENYHGDFDLPRLGGLGLININKTAGKELIEDGYPGKLRHLYICVLLHEMLHAFLRYYTCECRDCRAKYAPSEGGCGPFGHGPPWADAMLALGQTLQDIVPWPVETGVDYCVLQDAEDTNWGLNQEHFKRWGIGEFPGIIPHRLPPHYVYALIDQARQIRARARVALEGDPRAAELEAIAEMRLESSYGFEDDIAAEQDHHQSQPYADEDKEACGERERQEQVVQKASNEVQQGDKQRERQQQPDHRQGDRGHSGGLRQQGMAYRKRCLNRFLEWIAGGSYGSSSRPSTARSDTLRPSSSRQPQRRTRSRPRAPQLSNQRPNSSSSLACTSWPAPADERSDISSTYADTYLEPSESELLQAIIAAETRTNEQIQNAAVSTILPKEEQISRSQASDIGEQIEDLIREEKQMQQARSNVGLGEGSMDLPDYEEQLQQALAASRLDHPDEDEQMKWAMAESMPRTIEEQWFDDAEERRREANRLTASETLTATDVKDSRTSGTEERRTEADRIAAYEALTANDPNGLHAVDEELLNLLMPRKAK